jgi:hypothetical protein
VSIEILVTLATYYVAVLKLNFHTLPAVTLICTSANRFNDAGGIGNKNKKVLPKKQYEKEYIGKVRRISY